MASFRHTPDADGPVAADWICPWPDLPARTINGEIGVSSRSSVYIAVEGELRKIYIHQNTGQPRRKLLWCSVRR